ncbi:MAG: DUF5009 domain-containing protein [Planctomycetaceae bacterium]|nr:DUF5009 domain-containing protein [Planctomycetaceae bacterium]
MQNNSTPSENARLLSLDAFRGLTIMAMVMVNNPGTWSAVYPPLRHADWNGWTPTDLIFPFFVFMVGVSLVFSLQKRIASGASKCALSRKIILRSVIIFLLGMFLFFFHHGLTSNVSEIRFCGVLSRIAVVYLLGGLIFIYFRPCLLKLLCVLLLVGYCYCMTTIPIPGNDGKVMLEPGNNLAAYIDSKVMPFGHFYHQAADPEKNRLNWDPEGPFSTIPALATCLIGIFAGLLLRNSEKTQERKVIILFFSGFLLLLGGYFWGLHFPINKPIWSSSYVLLTSGFACLILASCVYFVDMLGYKRIMYPAVVFGSNAITIYCLSSILAGLVFYEGTLRFNYEMMNIITQAGYSNEFASMYYALFFVAVNFIPAWLLYYFRIFVRV